MSEPSHFPAILPEAQPVAPDSPAGRALSTRAKQAILHVRVVDENGQERVPKGGDAVHAGERLPYRPADGFTRVLEGKGELVVQVRFDGFEPVEQRFRYDAPAQRPTLAPFWPGSDEDPSVAGRRREGYLLACMQLNRAAGGHDEKRSPKVFHLTVTLHPTRMAVAVIGCDYWEQAGTPRETHRALDFDKYALTHAEHLAATGVVNLSSPMTWIDCQRGRIERWDRVRVDGSISYAWKRHSILQKRSPCPKWTSGKEFQAWREGLLNKPADAGAFYGARDVYSYLHDLGNRTPGVVIDFSIFSHAWHGGPILFNTLSSPNPGRADLIRWPGDLDMRFEKDFVAPNATGWPGMPKALAADAVVRVWGCFSTDLFNQMVRFLLGEGDVKGRFQYKDKSQNLDIDLDRNGVIKHLRETINGDSYMARIAKFAKRSTYGGLPGFGADNAEYGSIPTLPAALRAKLRGQICHVPRITLETRFRKLFEAAELGAQRFNEFGYMLYKP